MFWSFEGVRVRTAHIKIGGIVLHHTDAVYPGLRKSLQGMENGPNGGKHQKRAYHAFWLREI